MDLVVRNNSRCTFQWIVDYGPLVASNINVCEHLSARCVVTACDWLLCRKGTSVVDLSGAGDMSSYATLVRSDGMSLYITRSDTHTLTLTHTHSRSHTHTYTHSRSHTLTHAHTHSHTRSHTHSHMRTHTRSHTLRHTVISVCLETSQLRWTGSRGSALMR